MRAGGLASWEGSGGGEGGDFWNWMKGSVSAVEDIILEVELGGGA